MANDSGPSLEVNASQRVWIWLAFLCAAATLAGSLGLSYGLGLKACPLCFYQRTFIMSLVAVLGIGLLTPAGRGARLAWLALPLAVAGLGVASFHVFLELSGKLECPAGVIGAGTAPQQSMAMFLLLTSLLVAGLVREPSCFLSIGSSLLIGLLLALASSTSNPPMPSPPDRPYPGPPEICRPPYRTP
ncbi:MAG: disulfide bond formation protein B [Planctomycetes bacterium]|nr:disulfide bond formation protein B [Planctomycetota bacterium]